MNDQVYINFVNANYYLSKAAIDIMMQDVNTYEDYTFTVSDENWLNFCLFFNECVQTYDVIDEELHYFRQKLNRAPATLAKMIKTIEKDKSSWILCTIWETRYHMTGENGEFNLKFVSSNSTNNIFEAVYDKNGILLTEKKCPKNMGTYNYAGTKTNNSLHHKFDVDTYFLYGNWNCQEMCSQRIPKIMDSQISGNVMSQPC